MLDKIRVSAIFLLLIGAKLSAGDLGENQGGGTKSSCCADLDVEFSQN